MIWKTVMSQYVTKIKISFNILGTKYYIKLVPFSRDVERAREPLLPLPPRQQSEPRDLAIIHQQ